MKDWLTRNARNLIPVIISAMILIGIVYLFGLRPNQQLNQAKPTLQVKEFIELKNGVRAGLAQALGGAILLIGLFFTWRNIKATEKNLVIAQDNLRTTQENAARNISIALEGQMTDRFTKAIEQLGDNRLEVRLGGIYALERIAKDSEKDYWTIIEVLTAFVREKARWKDGENARPLSECPPADIQAVLNVIKRRARSYKNGEEHIIDLRQTDLRRSNLMHANLKAAHLWGAHMEGALLIGSNLDSANLLSACLDGANLTGAVLTDTTRLKDASFKGAIMMEKDLKDVVGLTPEERAAMAFVDLESFLDAIKDDEATVRLVKRKLSPKSEA